MAAFENPFMTRGVAKFMAYYALVLSYIWRTVGVFVVGINSWLSISDPTIGAQWVPWWASLLLLAGIYAIGYVMARIATAWIVRATGRRPWQRKLMA